MIIEKPSRTYAWFHDVTTQDIEVNRGEGIGAHKVLAGSPIDENGNVANDETAIGLLMETVSDANPDGKIIVAGDVDALGAKNASGIELSDAAKNALIGITWREPDYVVEMQAGGSDPVLANAKSTGGIGWTEQGEQTVITWDGDTEGKTVVEAESVDTTLVLVSDKTPSSVIGGTFEVSNIGSYNIDTSFIPMIGEWGYVVGEVNVVVIFEDGTTVDELGGVTFEHKGVYFYYDSEIDEYTTSLTYGGDTIHKIDEKYLPVIPAAPSDDGTYTLTCTVTDGEPAYSWESTT